MTKQNKISQIKIFNIIIIVLALLFILSQNTTIKETLGMSFINPDKNVYEVIYKGKHIAAISQRGCAITYFDGKDYPKPIFNTELQISKDYEHIRHLEGESEDVWENGILVKSTNIEIMQKTVEKLGNNPYRHGKPIE